MKTQMKYSVWLLLGFLASCSGMKTTPQKIQEVTQKIQSKDYTISVRYANPMHGSQFYLTSEYDVRIKNDSAFAYLPFFGVAYSAPYGGGEGGIKFAEPMKEYLLLSNKKSDGWEIRFKVKAKEDYYEFFMSVFNSGSAMITVNSINRQGITFTGELKNEEK